MRLNYLIFFMTILLISNNLFSEEKNKENNTGIIAGRLLSKTIQKPLIAFTVRILGTKMGTYTNSNGNFLVKIIPPGIYSVQFSGIGYETYVQPNVSVNPGLPENLEIELVEKMIILDGLEVRSSYFIKN